MPDIKLESREQSLPPVATPSSDGTGAMTPVDWDASMELALLNAIANCKPVGIHKHFRIMCVQRQFNETSPAQCSIREIWERLGDYYGMSALDELEEEDKEEEEEEEQQQGDEGHVEFTLPTTYDIPDQQQDTTRENSPSIERPPARRTRTSTSSKRDVSPAVTESSVASTPEPEEGKSISRRTARTRKSEANTPEPVSSRGTSSITSSTSASRRSNRTTTSTTTTTKSTRRQSKRKS
ncbi:chromatin modification-related protein EAF7-domain-containing protein [Halteromyces radiatus]|uniref:chromatin modification-related protein EAF7-domain-containing protein n=1 Tax=Halteromyces radiatus TaxID=101107 RepID=UPI00221F17C0|nr:chromatin modification-related protein EAF7-domain-containing protein [Halteromyces radiatus]KAI8083084.1 chromatin modification-related protein EAF7-domain-containing protein [Halteromyces radiatus]